jgi:hypothetical protein
MEIIQDHQKCAEECVMMARSSKRYSDKALWLILAQSWARLAEQVAFTEGRDDLSRAEFSAAALPIHYVIVPLGADPFFSLSKCAAGNAHTSTRSACTRGEPGLPSSNAC